MPKYEKFSIYLKRVGKNSLYFYPLFSNSTITFFLLGGLVSYSVPQIYCCRSSRVNCSFTYFLTYRNATFTDVQKGAISNFNPFTITNSHIAVSFQK